MFTGLVEKTAHLERIDKQSTGYLLSVSNFEAWPDPLKEGESIAINGACMTVVSLKENQFSFALSPESLERTCFKIKKPGDAVNLERALRLGDRLGGHWVTGHIDGVGQISAIERLDSFFKVSLHYPSSLDRYFVEKGSISIDGVSLTINQVTSSQNQLELMIVPHTWENTIFSTYKVNDSVNLEVDILAKHIEKLNSKETK